MTNTFSLQQISRTSNLDANLISREYKLNLMADSLRVNYEKPKLKQREILGLPSSTLQGYRNDINMLSPYRIYPNKQTKKVECTNFDNNSHREHDLERPQMTSNDLTRTLATSNENSKKVETKNNIKGGFVQENVEFNDQYLDESLRNNNR